MQGQGKTSVRSAEKQGLRKGRAKGGSNELRESVEPKSREQRGSTSTKKDHRYTAKSEGSGATGGRKIWKKNESRGIRKLI